jgi:hypothetical protein
MPNKCKALSSNLNTAKKVNFYDEQTIETSFVIERNFNLIF